MREVVSDHDMVGAVFDMFGVIIFELTGKWPVVIVRRDDGSQLEMMPGPCTIRLEPLDALCSVPPYEESRHEHSPSPTNS
jgi:hypothetical protein